MTCENCQESTKRVIQQKSGSLWCPACHEVVSRAGIEGTSAVFRDDIPGGVTVENYGPKPLTFYSHSDRRRYMLANGLREKETFSPLPGTDIDPAGIPNPAGYMDPQTLKNAAELICRNGKGADFDPSSVMTLSSGTISRDEALRLQQESRE